LLSPSPWLQLPWANLDPGKLLRKLSPVLPIALANRGVG